jgi:hypothetical protein
MTMRANTPIRAATKPTRPLLLLAGYSLLIGVVTGIPQLYYLLFALNRGAFPIGPNANVLGALWYNYILGGHQGGYLQVDAGVLTGALEDVFMLTPLYLATGLGLLRLHPWVYSVGLITGAMGLYAILYFFLSDILAQNSFDAADLIATTLSAVPYFAYDVWLLATLLTGRSLFARREST